MRRPAATSSTAVYPATVRPGCTGYLPSSKGAVMKHERVVTSISWIPSEAIKGALKVPFEVGMAHYDDPLPDVVRDLEPLRAEDRFRFANELRAWIDVEDASEGWGGRSLPARGDSRITGFGYSGGGQIGATTLRLGSKEMAFAAAAYPTLHGDPQVGTNYV